MKLRTGGLTVTALAALAFAVSAGADEKKPDAKKPNVEVVFVLDTTGSMSGLIDGAKAKIWAISNQIAGGKPTPNLKVGLVAYRDKGDAYVTQVHDLTDDLDAVYANLKTFKADGGGDTPEHVNQALHDAVHKVKWGDDKQALRIIFLVGDAAPHMDYKDDVKYPETCQKAVAKGIIINTIQCGNDPECTKAWKDICVKAEGSYAAIAQGGGVVAVATPFDKDLAAINSELAKSVVVFGAAKKREADAEKAATAATLPAPAAADRAGFIGKGDGRVATYDLVDALKAKEVKLEELKDDQLPDEMRKMTLEERKAHVKKVEGQRAELVKKAADLDKKRTDFLAEDLKKRGKDAKDAFDNQVLEMLRSQAKRAKIDY